MTDPLRRSAPLPAGTLHLPAVDERDREEVFQHVITLIDQLAGIEAQSSEESLGSSADDPDRAGALTHGEALSVIVPIVEMLFEGDVRELSLAFHAQLIVMCAFPSIPESLAVQVAFGRDIGEAQFMKIERLAGQAERRGLTLDKYIHDLWAADAIPHDRGVGMFLGETPTAPSSERLRHVIALLRRTAALAPEAFRPPMLCAIAWMLWAQGKRAVAMAYVAEARSIEPASVLAYGLSEHFSEHTPAWLHSSDEKAASGR